MKRIIRAVMIISLLLTVAMTYAQSIIPLPDADTAIVATFYDGNPFGSGKLQSTDFTVLLSGTSIGRAIHDVEDANYVMLDLAGTEIAFETWGITSTTSTALKNVNNGENMLLGDAVQDIYAALTGGKELAIFTNNDGIVKGFYSYYPDVDTNVNVKDADLLMVFEDTTCTVYETADAGATKLKYINVSVDGALIPFGHVALQN